MANFIFLLIELWALGAVAYVLGSFVLGMVPVIGPKVAGFNLDLVMNMLGRALLIKREHGGFILKKSSFDPAVGEERVDFGGEWRYFDDPHGFMSTFRGRPFGIAHGARNTIVTPVECHLAELAESLDSDNELVFEKNGQRWIRSFFHLNEGTQLVDVDAILNVIQGSATSASADRAMHFIELSQSKYDSVALEDVGLWISGLIFPFMLMLVASKVTDGSTGSSGVPDVSIGMMIDLATVIA